MGVIINISDKQKEYDKMCEGAWKALPLITGFHILLLLFVSNYTWLNALCVSV